MLHMTPNHTSLAQVAHCRTGRGNMLHPAFCQAPNTASCFSRVWCGWAVRSGGCYAMRPIQARSISVPTVRAATVRMMCIGGGMMQVYCTCCASCAEAAHCVHCTCFTLRSCALYAAARCPAAIRHTQPQSLQELVCKRVQAARAREQPPNLRRMLNGHVNRPEGGAESPAPKRTKQRRPMGSMSTAGAGPSQGARSAGAGASGARSPMGSDYDDMCQ